MTRRRRFLSLSVLCTLASACLPGGRPPDFAHPRRGAGLGARGDRPSPAATGPFALTFAGPEGENIEHPEPSLAFNRPIHVLGQPVSEPPLRAHFTPPVAGRWVWVGSSGARFVAEGTFQEATEYTLEIEPGLRALDGSTLTEPVRARFSTPRPELYGAGDLREGVEPDEKIDLYVSQTISREELLRKLRVENSTGQALPFTLEQGGKVWDGRSILVPTRPWPDEETIRVTLLAGAVGQSGPLPTDQDQVYSFSTRPLPHVESIDCSRNDEDNRCNHGSYVSIQTSEPVRPSVMRRLLRVTPAIQLTVEDNGRHDEPVTWFTVQAPFETDKTYKIEVIPPAPGPTKAAPAPPPPAPPPPSGKRGRKPPEPEPRPLARGASAELRFAPEQPSVIYSFGGTYLPLSEKAELGAAASFTTRASVAGRRLDPDTILALEMAPDRTAAAARLPGWSPVDLPSDLHALSRWISLAPSAPTGPGAFLFLQRWQGFSREQTAIQTVQRTDLGLTTRTTPDRTLVWVTHLSTGAPVEGVSVEVRDGQGHQTAGTTDKEGLVDLLTPGFGARTPRKKDSGEEEEQQSHKEGWRLVFARQGEDQAYLRTSVPRSPRMNAMLYTDRGLYRPGDSVYIKGYARRPSDTGMESPEGLPVRLHIKDPGDHGHDIDTRLSAWGSFSHKIDIGKDTPLGYHRATLFTEDGTQLASVNFQTEEYHPASFRVTGHLDREQYIRGDHVKCEVQARYLYGGSMDGARVQWYHDRRPGFFQIPGLPNVQLGEDDAGPLPYLPDRFREATLDRAGQASTQQRIDNPGQHGPERFLCEASVFDINWESLAVSYTALVHPGEVYVALERPGRQQLAPGESITPRVLTPTPEGRLRSMPVRLELWHRPREIEGKQGPEKLIQSCEVTTGDKARGCALQAPAARVDRDDRFYVRASTRDGRGNEIRSGLRYYPTAEPRRAPLPVKPRKEKKKRPELELQVPEGPLESGETAHVSLRSPFAQSHALVTVERNAILEHRVIALDQPETRLDLPLTDADAPWVKVRATVVSPLADRTNANHYQQAYRHLNVTPTSRALDVRLRPSKTDLGPGEEVEVEVEVVQGNGQPARAEVTLYAADEGTLQLAGYRLPEPLHPLYDNRTLTVEGQQSRDSLGWAYDWKAELERGGSGVGFGRFFGSGHGRLGGSHTTKAPQVRMGATTVSRPRRDFRQMALFLPDLVTDEQGRVKAHFTLPDSTTSYRLMAVAVTRGDQAGSAETSLTTSKRLQVNPSVPHVIRIGDRFEVLANVANNGREALEAQVSLRAPGLEPQAPPPRRVSLGPGERTTVAFSFAALHAGSGELTMQVSSPLDSDATAVPVVVVPPLAPETQSIYGQTDGAVVEQLGDLSLLREDSGGLDVTLSATPLAGLGAGLEQLLDYPYGCTEQTISRLVPLLTLRDLARATRVTLPSDLDAAAQRSIDRVLRNQTEDGGFALWPGMSSSIRWLTIHAFWGLQEARQRGMKVETRALDRARERVIDMALRWSASDHDAALAAQALDALASDPDAPADLALLTSQLFAHRAELPVFARARLLHAMARLRSPADEQATLVKELEGTLRLDGPLVRAATHDDRYLDQLDSEVRTSALVLRALVASSPEHPLLGGLAQGLLADRKGGTWRTTHETTWALLALDDFRRATLRAPVQLDARMTLGEGAGESLLLAAHFAGDAGMIIPEERVQLSMSALRPHSPADLTINAHGGRLYYQARLHFSPQAMPTEPLSVGLELRRHYAIIPVGPHEVDDRASWQTPVTSIPEGSFVRVQLDLVASGLRRYVVVDDPLPGGLEAVNLGLHGGPRSLENLERHGASRVERRDDRVVFFFDDLPAGPRTITYVARATRKGIYVTPPAHAEEMYTPETMGRTESLSVTVK